MILQYGIHNRNLSFEEAETITYAYINVDEITKKYRGSNRPNFETEKDEQDWALSRVRKMQLEVEEYICRQTNAANICYNIGDLPFSEMTTIAVVMLDDKNKHITRVFDKSDSSTAQVYMLNGKGQTVCRIV